MTAVLIALVVLNLCVFIVAVRRSREPFGLPVWIAVYFLIYFGIGNIIFAGDGSIHPQTMIVLLASFLVLQFAVALSLRPIAGMARPTIIYEPAHVRSTWLVFVAVGIVLALGFFARAQMIPLLAEDPETARKIAIAGNGFLLQGLVALLPAALLLGFDYRRDLPLYWPVFLFVILGMVGLAFRGPVVFFLIQFAFMYYVTGRRKKFYVALSLSVIPIAFLVVFITATRQSHSLLEFASLLWTFKVNILNYQKIAAVLDWNASFLIGQSYLMDLSILVPGDFLKGFGWWVTDFINETHGGISTPTIFGEALLNFGRLGSYLYLFIIGLILGRFYSRFRWSPHYRHRILIPLCFIPLTRALTGGFSSVFVMLVLPALFFYLVWDVITRSNLYTRMQQIRGENLLSPV